MKSRSKETGGLTLTQQDALVNLAYADDMLLTSDCHYRRNGTYKKMDIRTVVALVAKGHLEGINGRITLTKGGFKLAKKLVSDFRPETTRD